jgi:hypothetical protein
MNKYEIGQTLVDYPLILILIAIAVIELLGIFLPGDIYSRLCEYYGIFCTIP